MEGIDLTNLLPQLGLAAYVIIHLSTRMTRLEDKVDQLRADFYADHMERRPQGPLPVVREN